MLNLSDLANGCPAITPGFGEYLAQAGAVCLESQGHTQGKSLDLQGDQTSHYSLKWPQVTAQIQRCLHDPEEATELGATGIAVLLAKKITGFTAVQRSRKGTGFDYWLGEDKGEPFQNKARLEISGIRCGGGRDIKSRVAKKLKQTNPSDNTGLPAYICIVEFSQPVAEVRQKCMM